MRTAARSHFTTRKREPDHHHACSNANADLDRLNHLADEPHTRLRYYCSPQHTDSALYPIASQIEDAAGFAHDDTAE
jgi:hypothetical protein